MFIVSLALGVALGIWKGIKLGVALGVEVRAPRDLGGRTRPGSSSHGDPARRGLYQGQHLPVVT